MDDISRELPPDETGATPVSERQKGPEELQRLELGHAGESADVEPQFGDRIASLRESSVDWSDRIPAASMNADSQSDEPGAGEPGAGEPVSGEPVSGREEPQDAAVPDLAPAEQVQPISGEVEAQAEPVSDDASGTDQGSTAEGSTVDSSTVDSSADPSEADPSNFDPSSADTGGEQVELQLAEGDDVEAVEAEKEVDAVQAADAEIEAAADGRDIDEAIDAEAAQAAVEAEASTAEVEGDLDELADNDLGEDGLPIVPELKDAGEVARMVYVLMMTSRETMSVFRLAQACNTTQKIVEEALVLLQEQLKGLGLPVELTRTGDSVRWMSGAIAFPYLQRLRGVKKLEKLSPAALETLAVIAYRQPVMRSEIEAIRGVKAGPMLRTLLQHKLVKVAGRAEVPGKPLQYGTTQQFLERFGLASLQELPSVKEWQNLG